jgi:integrase
VRRLCATIEEHPKGSGLYRVRAREAGKLVTIASKLAKADAEETADAYRNVRAASELRQGVTVAQFGVGFLDRRERAGIRGIRTDRNYWKNHIANSSLAALPVATLERRDIVEWRNALKPSGHRTRVKILNLLRVALSDAVELGLLESNPAREVKIHRASAARSKDDLEGILTPPEQRALLMAIPDATNRALVTFALLSGLRQAEQWWLRLEDVLPDRVIVRRSVGGLPPKNGMPREVFLLGPAAAAIQLMPRRRSGYVFAALRGGRRSEGKAPRGWKAWVRAAGISRRIRWHDLRHTCATSLLAGWWGRKWSLDEVCRLLGHSSVKVTERYARKLAETQRLAVAQTPMLEFPGGNTGVAKLLTSQDDTGAFVKRRSQVQIQLSAPALRGGAGEHTGNFSEQDFRAALVEHADRAAVAEVLRGGS